MPTLLELQNALRQSLIEGDDGAAAAMLAAQVRADRLDIYRNTFLTGVTNALRLSFPAVHRLVGEDFFCHVAALFITRQPPRAAYLDQYGADFPEFLAQFPAAATLVYLADVARVEWAVSSAIHAADREPLALNAFATLAPGEHDRVRLVPHPCVSLLRAGYAVDAIWRAVLDRDDAALATLDLAPSPIYLLVQRLPTGVEVTRLTEAQWRFAAALCAGQPLQAALDAAADVDATAWLAGHLASGRFVAFTLAPPDEATATAA